MSSTDPVVVHGDSYLLKTETVHALQDELQRLRDALKDISQGASMMLQGPVPALHRYAAEVLRVAELALKGATDG